MLDRLRRESRGLNVGQIFGGLQLAGGMAGKSNFDLGGKDTCAVITHAHFPLSAAEDLDMNR